MEDAGSIETQLQVGPEIEFPIADGGEYLVDKGAHSRPFLDDMGGVWNGPGHFGSDPTVGVEINPRTPIHIEDAPGFYRGVLEEAEACGWIHQPSGVIDRNGGNSTAGLHIHISELTRREANELRELSQDPLTQVFVCSSVTRDDLRVFRGGSYCQMDNGINDGHHSVVNEVSSRDGHYEWRLPEPMTPENFDLTVNMLQILKAQGAEAAYNFMQSVLDRHPDAVTSVKRAERIGGLGSDVYVSRTKYHPSGSFFDDVVRANSMPYIYRVTIEGEEYYAFETQNDDYHDKSWELGGFKYPPVEVTTDTVLDADALHEVTGDRADEVRTVVRDRDEYSEHNTNETPATDVLKETVKKV